MLPEVLERVVENIENRYYGKYRGKITDNRDPKSLGRIRAIVPEILDNEETGWALPCLPYGGSKDAGFFVIPTVGSNVWIEFESGNLSYPIWSGVWWGEPSGNEVPSEAQKPEPTVKILKTNAGHKIELHDSSGEEKITITHMNGNILKIENTGITISSDNGMNNIKLDSSGISLSRGASSIKITDSSININNGALEIM